MPKPFDQSRAPGHLLRRAHQVSVDFYVAEVGEAGPTPPQFAFLLMVERHPGASQAELVRLTGIDRSTLAEMARRLVARGLLARRKDAADGRANALRITAGGRRMVAATLPKVALAQARVLALLPRKRRAAFIADLRTLIAAGEDAYSAFSMNTLVGSSSG
jgi:DNA-binding MarR family transcriptional regulator